MERHDDDEPQILDLTRLHDTAWNDPRLEQVCLRSYLNSGEQRLRRLERAVARRDARAMHAAGHALKCSSDAIGAVGVEAACRALVTLGARGEVALAREATRAARRRFEQLRPLIEERLERRAA